MDIKDFVSALLPTFGRDRILEDLRITKGDISNLIPVYTEAARFFKSHKVKSELVKEKFGVFRRLVGGPGSDNAVVHIAEHLPEILSTINEVEKMVTSWLNSNVAGEGLTIKQATVVRYSDCLYLVAKYARKFLNFVYVYEVAEYPELTTLEAKDSIPKAEMQWIESSLIDFCHAYMACLGKPEQIAQQMGDIPDIQVSRTNTHTLSNTIGPRKLDPRSMGFVASKYNPIYFVRMAIAEWQVRRYKAAKEELTALELRLVQLQKLEKNQADAKIEKQIAYLESRIQNLNYDISEMEKS